MGLITKAVDKVENKEESPVIPEAPSPPDKRKQAGKKRFLLLVALLALVVASCAVGYLLFLRPTAEVPPKATRRSISARKKMAGLPAASVKKTEKPGAGGESGTAKETSPGTDGQQQPAEKSGLASKPGEKPAKSKAQVSVGEAGDRSPQPQKESTSKALPSEAGVSSSPPKTTSRDRSPDEGSMAKDAGKGQVAAPERQQPAEVVLGPLPKPEEKLKSLGPLPDQPEEAQEASKFNEEGTTATSTPGGTQESEGDMSEDVEIPELDDTTTPEMIQAQPSEPAKTRPQRELVVSDRSDSRAESYYKKGVSYQRQGELSKAIESYRQALNYNPDHLQANMNLATAYLQAGRFKQAEQILVYLYASRPKDSRVLYNFGVLLYQTGELSSAESKLEKLLEMDPFHLEAYLLLATIYEDKKEMDRAVKACMKAHQINSAHPRVLYRLGRIWDLIGDPAEAASYYQRFLSCRSEKEPQLELAVRDRLKYLATQKED